MEEPKYRISDKTKAEAIKDLLKGDFVVIPKSFLRSLAKSKKYEAAIASLEILNIMFDTNQALTKYVHSECFSEDFAKDLHKLLFL